MLRILRLSQAAHGRLPRHELDQSVMTSRNLIHCHYHDICVMSTLDCVLQYNCRDPYVPHQGIRCRRQSGAWSRSLIKLGRAAPWYQVVPVAIAQLGRAASSWSRSLVAHLGIDPSPGQGRVRDGLVCRVDAGHVVLFGGMCRRVGAGARARGAVGAPRPRHDVLHARP